jgi:hypothetical protein
MADTSDERDTRLDGNAAAGLLTEVFRCEPSGVVVVCAGCGAVEPMGSLLAYSLEMGAILRCPTCDTAVLRAGSVGPQLWIDLRGAVSVRIKVGV